MSEDRGFRKTQKLAVHQAINIDILMAQSSHVHQVTPIHRSKSGGSFFPDEPCMPPQKESLRDLMNGISEEDEEMDEENMYAHELPPDPFKEKLTIQEEEDQDDECYGDDFEDSATSFSSEKKHKQKTEVVSPILSSREKSSPKKSEKTPSRSPRNTLRSPRLRSGGSRKNSSSKLRQSPIRINASEAGSPKKSARFDTEISPVVPKSGSKVPRKGTPKNQVSMSKEDSKGYSDVEWDYDDEDFAFESESPAKGQSSKSKKQNDTEYDDDCDFTDPLKDVDIEGEQNSNLIEGKIEGLTLEEYMTEYTKAKSLDELRQESDDQSPPVIDPQGLEGCSPGPGQRHINGTSSPFRIDKELLCHNEDIVRGSCNDQNGEILSAILTQVQDVQSKLVTLSSSQNPSPVKNSISSPMKFQPSPIEYEKEGAKKSPLQNKEKRKKDEESHPKAGSDAAPEVKIDVLKRQLKKKNDDLRKAEEKMKRMERDMDNMRKKLDETEAALSSSNKKVNKANKAKASAQKKVAEMTQEMSQFEALIQAIEDLRGNEEKLLHKIGQLEEQNIEVSKALKSSMSRELEWRALYRKEHGGEGQSGMNSHRSLPDPDRSHVRPSKPIYERNSITEGRQKKKSKRSSSKEPVGNNRQKVLPILMSKQRK